MQMSALPKARPIFRNGAAVCERLHVLAMYNLAAERACPACFDSVRLLTNVVFACVEQICQAGPRSLLHISNLARQM